MYRLASGAWLLDDIVYPANPVANDYAGISLELAGDRLVVAAPLANERRGEAHVFASDVDVGELSVPGLEPDDLFSGGVAVRGDLIAVGWCRGNLDLSGWSATLPAPPGATDAGAGLLYDATTRPPALLGALGRAMPMPSALFGCIHALSTDRWIAAAYGEDDGPLIDAGAVYVVE